MFIENQKKGGRNLRLNWFKKRGSMLDMLWLIVMILVLFIAFTTSKLVWDNISDSPQWNQTGNNTNIPEVTKIIQRYDQRYMPLFDNFFAFLIIGSFISILILAYFIRGEPVLLAIMVIIMTFGAILSVFVSNAYDDIVSGSNIIADTIEGWTMMDFLITNLPMISLFFLVGLIVVILSFAGTREAGGGIV